MTTLPDSEDPRADQWLGADGAREPDLRFLGAPSSTLSLSPSRADTTPAAFRRALARFPLWYAEHQADLSRLRAEDRGDTDMTGTVAESRERLTAAVAAACVGPAPAVICGGDNSVTVGGVAGLARGRDLSLASGAIALITLDAHHDLRSPAAGPSNGTPVRELLQMGLPAACVIQIGIGPLANSRSATEFARDAGIVNYSVADVRKRGIERILEEALARVQGDTIYVDFDLDVLDRAFAPGCHASLPGGLWPADLFSAAYRMGRAPRVAAIDIVEVDAAADVAESTVRTAAHLFLSFSAGLLSRFGAPA